MNGPTYPVMGLSKWRKRARAGQASDHVTLRKGLVSGEVKEIAGQDRSLNFTISTASVDRDSDTIDPAGWDLRHYAKSPTVLWAHDYSSLPIAKATAVTKDLNRLLATAQFPTPDLYPFGAQVYDLLRAGFLNATSVGFRPLKWKENEHGGIHFEAAELLEFSVVPVGANPEALIEAGKKNFDHARVLQWFNGGAAPHAKAGDEDFVDLDEALYRQQVEAMLRGEIAAVLKPILDHAMMMNTGRVPD